MAGPETPKCGKSVFGSSLGIFCKAEWMKDVLLKSTMDSFPWISSQSITEVINIVDHNVVLFICRIFYTRAIKQRYEFIKKLGKVLHQTLIYSHQSAQVCTGSAALKLKSLSVGFTSVRLDAFSKNLESLSATSFLWRLMWSHRVASLLNMYVNAMNLMFFWCNGAGHRVNIKTNGSASNKSSAHLLARLLFLAQRN